MTANITSGSTNQTTYQQTNYDYTVEYDLTILNSPGDYIDPTTGQAYTEESAFAKLMKDTGAQNDEDLQNVVVVDDFGNQVSLYEYSEENNYTNTQAILAEHGMGPAEPVDPIDPVQPEEPVNPDQQVIDDLAALDAAEPNSEEYDAAWNQLMVDIGGEENINTYTIEEDGNSYSLFGYAVTHDEPNAAQAFLDHPATINEDGTVELDGFDVNTIAMADAQGNTTSSITLAILASETDPAFGDIAIEMMNMPGADLSYPFFEAVDMAKKPPYGEGDYYALDFMLANQPEGSDLVNIEQAGNNQTALEQAINIDDTKLAATLIAAGADTEGTTTSGLSYEELAEHTYYLDPNNTEVDERGVPIPSQGDPTMIGLLNGSIDANDYLNSL